MIALVICIFMALLTIAGIFGLIVLIGTIHDMWPKFWENTAGVAVALFLVLALAAVWKSFLF